jgi:hypothetical protein
MFSKNARMRDAPARVSRGLDPISAMSWGRKPVRRGQQGRTSIRMAGIYADRPAIASNKKNSAGAPQAVPHKACKNSSRISPAG